MSRPHLTLVDPAHRPPRPYRAALSPRLLSTAVGLALVGLSAIPLLLALH